MFSSTVQWGRGMCSKMMKVARPMHRRPLALVLVCSALVFSLVILAAQYSLFSGIKGYDANTQDVKTLYAFQHEVKQCVQRNGLGLIANIVDQCKIILAYPEGTNSTWYNEQFKIYEPLEYTFDVCASLLLWEQYRNMTTILTREYLDSRPDGWLTYAAKRIAQLGVDKCYNLTLCEEHLSLVLPSRPPFHPRQFETCAVVGNSGDLLKNEFGHEIDDHDAVIRDNEAPVNKIKDLILEGEALRSSLFQVVPSIDARQNYYWKYAKHVGMKRNFRLMARGVARNMPKVVNGSADEVLIIKSVIHRDFNTMIKELPNPVYLFQGVVLRRGAKGTGMKSIELALSMCDTVDIYGFTVDPGYTEWTRYFSSPRKGHNPLQGRAYYQLLECLGVIRIHSPMREQRKQDWSVVPSRAVVNRAHTAARRLKGSQNEHPDSVGPFSACKVWASATSEVGPVSGSPDMSPVRRSSNYSKWELLKFSDLRNEAREHHKTMKGVAMYKIDGNKLEDLVCVKHPLDSEI